MRCPGLDFHADTLTVTARNGMSYAGLRIAEQGRDSQPFHVFLPASWALVTEEIAEAVNAILERHGLLLGADREAA